MGDRKAGQTNDHPHTPSLSETGVSVHHFHTPLVPTWKYLVVFQTWQSPIWSRGNGSEVQRQNSVPNSIQVIQQGAHTLIIKAWRENGEKTKVNTNSLWSLSYRVTVLEREHTEGLHAPHTSFSLQPQGSCNSPIVRETQQSHRERRSRASEWPRHHAFPPLEPLHGSSKIGPGYSCLSIPSKVPPHQCVPVPPPQRAAENTTGGVLASNSHRMKGKTFLHSLTPTS